MMATLLKLQQFGVDIETPYGRAGILRDLDLTVAPGERLGIVGESGSGKSMTALAIMGLLPESARVRGDLEFAGESLLKADEDRLCAIRGRRIAMIFQEPMTALNPMQTIGHQVAEGPRLHLGLSRRQASSHANDLLARVGLPEKRVSHRLYPHQLSGGQRQRVMIAIALACTPDLLIADEPTTALDVTTQTGILDLIVELAHEQGMGLIMISHDLGVIGRTTKHTAVMYAGSFVETGETHQLLTSMAHPYSRGLYRAMPQHAARSDQPAKERPRLPTIPGTVPDPLSPIQGCAFSSRCRHAEPDCRATAPDLASIGPAHFVACHHPEHQDRLLESIR
ncbi:MAG: ABC transporter ATP-binding protein [Geminicoccaceae bacterium]